METKRENRYFRKIVASLARDDPKTKEVVLNGFIIGGDQEKMAKLAMSLVGNNHIKILSLNNCGITSNGAHWLAYALDRNNSLDHVWLNNNKIGSSGAEAIASSLQRNQTLLTVALSNNSIGNHGGKALLKAIKQNHSMTEAFVGGNHMSYKIEDEINRICYSKVDSNGNDELCKFNYCDESNVVMEFDVSILSNSFKSQTLESIEEVDYESDTEGDSLALSSCPGEEPIDMDFSCFLLKKKQSKLSKLKGITGRMKRKKVKPGL